MQKSGTLVVNLFAGPGAGKTTAAHEITALLKKQGIVTEYVPEYAKELVFAEAFELLKDQKYVTGEQYRRINVLRGKVEVIVTDSPVLLGMVYGKKNTPEFNVEIDTMFRSFDNFNLFIQRGNDYEQTGRIENAEQAKEKDKEIWALLKAKEIYCGIYSRDSAEKIAQNIITTLRRMQNAQRMLFIPDELKSLKQWAVFKTYPDKEKPGKLKKIIINPADSSFAHSDMPETWAGYEQAKAYAEKYRYKGLVFALGKGITFIDIDNAVDKNTGEIISPEAKKILDLIPDSYTERSTSGTGLHILVKGSLPPDSYRRNDEKGIEMYDNRRFICMTGDTLNGSREIKDYSDRIAEIAYKFVGKRPPKKEYTATPATQADNDLIGQICNSKQGSKFQALYRGDFCGLPSHSHADSALVYILSWWTQDPAQIDRIFRSSGLMREKWDSRRGGTTYGGQIIDDALVTVYPREEQKSESKSQQYL